MKLVLQMWYELSLSVPVASKDAGRRPRPCAVAEERAGGRRGRRGGAAEEEEAAAGAGTTGRLR